MSAGERPEYANVWEDASVELDVLRPRAGDRSLCVTSGGCTALALGRSGARVLAVDMAFPQTAMLALKLHALLALPTQAAHEFLGVRRLGEATRVVDRAELYRSFAERLTPEVRSAWDGAGEVKPFQEAGQRIIEGCTERGARLVRGRVARASVGSCRIGSFFLEGIRLLGTEDPRQSRRESGARDWNRSAGWMTLALGVGSGLVLGMWSFDGPLDVPQWIGAYGDTSRRLVRLGHIALIGLGILDILLGRELLRSSLSSRMKQVASLAMIFGNAFLPLTLFAAGIEPSLKYTMALPAMSVFVALSLAAWGARGPDRHTGRDAG